MPGGTSGRCERPPARSIYLVRGIAWRTCRPTSRRTSPSTPVPPVDPRAGVVPDLRSAAWTCASSHPRSHDQDRRHLTAQQPPHPLTEFIDAFLARPGYAGSGHTSRYQPKAIISLRVASPRLTSACALTAHSRRASLLSVASPLNSIGCSFA